MTEPFQPTPSTTHAAHDLVLIAALAAREPDLSATDHAQGRELIESCAACRDLLADLAALQVALPAASTPSRPRDFSLTPADAARLRAGGWRRVLGFVGSARDGFSKPLAVGFTTLGLAGLLVATLPGALGGVTGGATVLSTVGGDVVAEGAPMQAQGSDRRSVSAAPGSSKLDEGGVFSGGNQEEVDASGERESDIAGEPPDAAIRDDQSAMSLLILVAGVLLIAGLGLFGLRWTARRLGDG
jgi:hypothetical protein